MNLYTSYWAQVRNFPTNLVGLNTTVWPPKYRPLGKDKNGVLVIDCPPFKPGTACNGLCDGKCANKHPDTCKFLQVYRNQLDDIDVCDFLTNLERLSEAIKEGEHIEKDIDFAFIFFEKWDNPCSERWPVQAWGQMVGLDIKEWRNNGRN